MEVAANTITPIEELLGFFTEESFSDQQIYRIQEILDINVSKLSVVLTSWIYDCASNNGAIILTSE